jgi:hypothetical protein
MVKSREELLEVASEWTNKAMLELKEKMSEFMDEHDADVEEIAHITGLRMATVEAILDGEGDIRISDLAKLLVATDQVLQIMPASETPITYGTDEDEEEEDGEEYDDDDEDVEQDEDTDSDKDEAEAEDTTLKLVKNIATFLDSNPGLKDFISKIIG